MDQYRPLLTIGYGNRPIEQFLDLLVRYDVHFLGDVRSRPFSRFAPDYSKDQLRHHLRRLGIQYVYLGDALGGNPSDPSVRAPSSDPDGKHYVLYERVMELPSFRDGMARLRRAWEQDVGLALMCSEAKPEHCHRSRLIGEALGNAPVTILHIDEHGELRSQEEVMLRIDQGQVLLPGVGLSAKAAKSSKAF